MPLSDKVKSSLSKGWKRRPEVLLQNNTVKPLHEVVPRLILGQQWWDRTRTVAYASTDWHCVACGVFKRDAKEHPWLEGHEVYTTDYKKGRQTYVETVPLCHYCHCFIHDGRLQILADKKLITKKKFRDVIAHGKDVLIAAGLNTCRTPPMVKMAKWEDWRLVLFGKEYPPKYKNYEDWFAHFNPEVEE